MDVLSREMMELLRSADVRQAIDHAMLTRRSVIIEVGTKTLIVRLAD